MMTPEQEASVQRYRQAMYATFDRLSPKLRAAIAASKHGAPPYLIEELLNAERSSGTRHALNKLAEHELEIHQMLEATQKEYLR